LLTGRKKRNVGHQTVHVSSNTIVVYDQNEGERPPPTSKLYPTVYLYTSKETEWVKVRGF